MKPKINSSKGKKPKSKFGDHPGITADAEALGCSRVHLWFVITGQRTSKRLSARYQALKASQKGGRP